MKKKVKLITTIASLGLALALMAFGVYAATQAQFSVTSTVTFTNLNVAATMVANVTGGTITTEGKGEGDRQVTVSALPLDANDQGEQHKNYPVALVDVKFEPAMDGENVTGDVIEYTFEITNDGYDAIVVTPSAFTVAAQNGLKVEMKCEENDDAVTGGDTTKWVAISGLTNGKKATYTLKLTLTNLASSLTAIQVNPVFTVSKVA